MGLTFRVETYRGYDGMNKQQYLSVSFVYLKNVNYFIHQSDDRPDEALFLLLSPDKLAYQTANKTAKPRGIEPLTFEAQG